MKVIIIGTGNVATVLGRRMKLAGHHILQVYGRTPDHAARLAVELSATYCTKPVEIIRSADIYLVALSDNALYELPTELNIDPAIICHTAGSVPADILKNHSPNYGVLYPLQSLRREFSTTTEIPLLTDGSNNHTLKTIHSLAATISSQVVYANDAMRTKLHLAAVIASNFTNHLYTLAEMYCETEGLDFKMLHPLIKETAIRVQLQSPSVLQTGPAMRDDQVTVHKHLQLLGSLPALQSLYLLLTKSIREKDNFVANEE
ncbi:MAG: DUF2520 domain-containing protein [Chitinophagaceae bacterium]|nr:DUF2520 domain-containing protein [Chitinophagaceae bacterium]